MGVVCEAGGERLIEFKVKMKKAIVFGPFILISNLCNSQNKTLKELGRNSREINTPNYIVLASKDKKEVKDIEIYSGGRGAGKATLITGEKIKFTPGDILECQ